MTPSGFSKKPKPSSSQSKPSSRKREATAAILQQMQRLLNHSRLTESETIDLGREIKRRMARRHLGTAKTRLLKQGLADARKGRVAKAKENYTKYLSDQLKRDEKPLSETNPYLRDPKLRKKLIIVAAATSSAIEGIRVPQKLTATALRPGWKLRRSSRRTHQH